MRITSINLKQRARQTVALVISILYWNGALICFGDEIPSSSRSDNSDDTLDEELRWLHAEAITITTASRFEETVTKAPGTAIVITRKQIKNRGYTNLLDLLRDLPGVDVQSYSDGAFFNRVAIRGITGNSKFLILQDGIRINSPSGAPILPIADNFSLYQAKQVEVVFGPASALYGADAFSGVINIITDDLASADTFQVTVEAGEFGYRRIHGYAKQQLTDSVSLSLGAHYHESNNPDLSDDFSNEFALQDLVTLGGTTVKQVAQRKGYRLPTDSFGTNAKLWIGESFIFGWNQSFLRVPPWAGDKPLTADYGSSATLQPFLNTAYVKYEFPINDDITANIQGNYSYYEIEPDSKFENIFTDFNEGFKYAQDERIQIEPHLKLSLDKHTLIGGFTFERFSSLANTADLNKKFDPDRPSSDQGLFYPGTNNSLPLKTFEIDWTNIGVFIQGSTQWNNVISTTLGVRYDNSSTYGDSVNPRLSLILQPWPDTTIKALYAEAFLAPTPHISFEHFGSFTGVENAQGLFESFFFRIPNPDLDPEQMQTMELSLTQQIIEGFDITLVGYYSVVEDFILPVPTDQPISDFIPGGIIFFTDHNDNIGELKSKGADMMLTYTTNWRNSTLTLWGSISYVDGELKNKRDGSKVELPFVAEKKAKFGFTYGYNNKLFISPSLQWIGETSGFIPDASSRYFKQRVPDYTLVNVYTRLQNVYKNLSLFMRVKNLFDKQHFNAGTGTDTTFFESPQEGRWFQFGLDYRF